MPSWDIHNKWAKELGIPKKASTYVNNLIDALKRVKNFHKNI